MGWLRWAERSIGFRITAPQLRVERRIAPDMQFQTLDGQTMHLSQAKGKVVFLDLWGTWCVQCVAEMPRVQALYERYRRDPAVSFLIVSRMDSTAKIRSFAARNHYTLPFYPINDADIPEWMPLNQFPSTFLFDKRGMLAVEHTGAADWASPSVLRVIEQLKAE